MEDCSKKQKNSKIVFRNRKFTHKKRRAGPQWKMLVLKPKCSAIYLILLRSGSSKIQLEWTYNRISQ